MAIAFRSATSVYSTSSPLVINKPAGTVEGDVLVASRMYYGDDSTSSPPSGWTLIDYASEATPRTDIGHRLLLYYKVAGASEPSTYSWPMGSDGVQSVAIACYSGVDTAAPINAYSIQFNGTSASMSAASITTTVANTMLVFAGCAGNSASFSATPPSGYTERVDFYADWRSIYIAEKAQAATGATGSATATINTSRINWGGLIALKPATLAVPNAPTLNTATAGNAQVALAWSAPGSGTTPTGYKVKYGTSAGSYSTTVDVGNVTSYTVTSLTNGTLYYFVVVAYNASGDGANSNELSATPTAGGSPPSAPTLVSLVPGSTQLVASWGSVAGATGYKVRIGTATGSYGAATSVGNVTTYTFTGLTNGTRYYAIVIASNGSGDSGNSNELNAVPSATSRIQTKYNDMAVGDVVFLEKLFTFEAMSVQQHTTPDAGKVYKSVSVNGQAGFEFEVTRNLDGTGKNDWLAGDSYVNTGSPGNGFIDQYSYTSVLARPLEYIAIDGALVDSFVVDLTVLSGSGSIAAFGVSNVKFDALHLTIKTPAIYTTATIVYEYWNGSAWASLTGVVSVRDANNAVVTADWKNTGYMSVVFTPPADWATTTIATKSAYWMRIRVSAATGWTQSPKHGGGKWITRGKRQYGPSIAFWRRMSSTWNDLREGGALGNLEGFYDYGVPTMGAAFGDPTGVWLGMDATNGIRMMNASTMKGQIKPDGTWKFYGDANNFVEWNGSQVNVKGTINVTAGSVPFSLITSVPARIAYDATPSGSGLFLSASGMGFYNGSAWRTYMNNAGQFFFYGASGALLQWDGNTLAGYNSSAVLQWSTDATTGAIKAGGGSVTIGSGGIRLYPDYSSFVPEASINFGDVANVGTFLYSSKRTMTVQNVDGSGLVASKILIRSSALLGVGAEIELSAKSRSSGFESNIFMSGEAGIKYTVTSVGRHYFIDSEAVSGRVNGLRVGTAWGMEGIYAEEGQCAIGGMGGVNVQNSAILVNASGSVGIGAANTDTGYARVLVSGGVKLIGGNTAFQQLSRNDFNQVWQTYAESNTWRLWATTVGDVMRVDTSGVASKLSAGTAWVSFSDARVKDVAGKYEAGLAEIMKLNPVVYDYNGKAGTIPNGRRNAGIIAQEIREILPETVAEDIQTGLLMFDSSEVIWTLVNAVKELASEVELLKVRTV